MGLWQISHLQESATVWAAVQAAADLDLQLRDEQITGGRHYEGDPGWASSYWQQWWERSGHRLSADEHVFNKAVEHADPSHCHVRSGEADSSCK